MGAAMSLRISGLRSELGQVLAQDLLGRGADVILSELYQEH